jgi:phage-related protein
MFFATNVSYFGKFLLYLQTLINNSIKKMKYEPRFDVIFSDEVDQFLNSIPEKPREKILSNIRKSRFIIDNELFKKLNGEIWEFRTIYNQTKYRLLAFWDKKRKKLVIVTHGFVKKTSKVSSKEIERAESIRLEYYKQNNE